MNKLLRSEEAVSPNPSSSEIHKKREPYSNMISDLSKESSCPIDWDYPPGFYIEQLSRHAPSCIFTYIKLWRMKDKQNFVYIFKDEILPLVAVKKPKFFDDLVDIHNEGLLNWSETKKEKEDMTRTLITIELTGWQDVFED